ncbi:hypothetical protein PR202_ga15192 [Eleusine coracana subsp. coracana]|uniref:non-specific serine/threonine protein kinase n=1 Tax=Eleusine coracana subsp. coracana TaxID=191504 RepID=A0AAV5CJA0_ELECO|nr:hypothetical protein PR202_ga15192 [Eleusine coracana subsp. coracana]
MHHSKILLLLLSLLITTSSSKLAYPDANKSFTVNAELGSIWKNNPSLLHNESPDDNFSMRLILSHIHLTPTDLYFNNVPSFSCGFFCIGPAVSCDAYIFSIFIVGAFILDDALNLQSPQVIWSANRDRPVSENATVQLTELGELVLYDADGTLVWSTTTADKSVVGMNLTDHGNLMLQVGQKLMASTSETNWSTGKVYLTVLPAGMFAFAGIDTPIPYYRSSVGDEIRTNISASAYIALKNSSLEVYTSFRATEAPDYQIQLPVDYYGLDFVRLHWNGHLRLYQWGNNNWVSSDVLDITDPCSYPLACGEYGVCSNGQCSCPDAVLRQYGLFELIDSRELNRGCLLTDSLSCETAQNASMLQEKVKNGQLMDLIDPRSTDMESHLEEVFRVMNLAMWCLQVDSGERPSMSMVVKILEGAMDVETELDLDLVNIDLMVANRAARWNKVTLQIESVLSGPRNLQ